MRLLIDEHDFSWDAAWDICCRTLSYTNHTVMSEALERWNVDLFREQLPRVYSICVEINRRLIDQLSRDYPNDWGKINYMAVIANNEIRMANLCLACCHKINGVSKLHTGSSATASSATTATSRPTASSTSRTASPTAAGWRSPIRC